MLTSFRDRLQRDFLLRWTLANVAGWTAGLYLGSQGFSTPAICLGGAIIGALVGAAQWYSAHTDYTFDRSWIFLSAAGGALATLPALLWGLMLLIGWGAVGGFLGAVLGGALGLGQWVVLRRRHARAGWWIAANIAAGIGCGLLALLPILPPLPIGLLLGSALYGYVTGSVLIWLSRQGR